MTEAQAVREVTEAFERTYGGDDCRIFFAPGRVNLIGEHIDYNGGHVFPCALPLGTYAAVRKRADRKLRFFSVSFPDAGVVESSLDDLIYKKEDDWANYVKGVIWAFEEHGYRADSGFDFVCAGTIPNKSGLSSSASLEVLTGQILISLFDFDADQVKNALYGQYAENKFVGMNCGIMDQFASAMGKKDSAIFLNTATLDYQYAPVELGDAKLVIVNSNKPHELTTSAYNDRRRECEEALEDLQKVRDIKALCELTPEEFEKVKDVIRNDVCLRRARHAVTEEARTVKAVQLLDNGDLEGFGKLMNGSHVSLRDDFETSCFETDVLAEEAWAIPGVLGARITGGGFGGCTVNIVKDSAVDNFIETVGKHYTDRTGLTASFYVVSVGGGPREI